MSPDTSSAALKLKLNNPIAFSPEDGERLSTRQPTLIVDNPSADHAPDAKLKLRFIVWEAAGDMVHQSDPVDLGDGSGMNLMDLAARRWAPAAIRATADNLGPKLPELVAAAKASKGTWFCTGEEFAPDGTAMKSKATLKNVVDLDKMWIKGTITIPKKKGQKRAMKMTSYKTYDATTKKWQMVGLDNMGGWGKGWSTGPDAAGKVTWEVESAGANGAISSHTALAWSPRGPSHHPAATETIQRMRSGQVRSGCTVSCAAMTAASETIAARLLKVSSSITGAGRKKARASARRCHSPTESSTPSPSQRPSIVS